MGGPTIDRQTNKETMALALLGVRIDSRQPPASRHQQASGLVRSSHLEIETRKVKSGLRIVSYYVIISKRY